MSVFGNSWRVFRAYLAVTILIVLMTTLSGVPLSRPAGAAPFDATFAGWSTASGLFPDEASAEFTVPQTSPTNAGLLAWVGLGGAGDVFQAGAGIDASAGVDGCFWADYPATNSVAISGLRCAPGDELFVDIAQAYYGPVQSRVIMIDLTTGQSTGWLSVFTPDLAWNTLGEALVETNTSLGATPSTFAPISFVYPTFIRNGYVGGSAQMMPLNLLAFFGLVNAQTSLAKAVPGTSLVHDWSDNVETIEG